MKKMNFKYLLFAAAMLVGFASCQKDDINGSGNGGEKKITKATISLRLNSPQTYALPATLPTEAPTVDEAAIVDITLYIFNDQKVLESIVPFEAADIAVTPSPQKEFETSTGIHYVYAVVNKPASFNTNITTGMNMYVVEKKLINIAAISEITASGNFFMTNEFRPAANTFIEVDEGDPVPTENQVTVSVGRAMSKVNVKIPATFVQPVNGSGTVDVASFSYTVAANPVQMYTFPVIRIAPETTFLGNLETPFFSAWDPDNVTTPVHVDLTKYFPTVPERTASWASVTAWVASNFKAITNDFVAASVSYAEKEEYIVKTQDIENIPSEIAKF